MPIGCKYKIALGTNRERIKGDAANAFKGADMVISASISQPGTIKNEWVKSMNKDPVIFALANPLPEIWPGEAVEYNFYILFLLVKNP